MSKEADRANLERMVREAMEKKAVGQTRAKFKCKECGHQQSTL
jgi:hypothetical protein